MLGSAHRAAGRSTDALAALDAALEASTQDPRATAAILNDRAGLLLAAGREDEAAASLRRAVKAAPAAVAPAFNYTVWLLRGAYWLCAWHVLSRRRVP